MGSKESTKLKDGYKNTAFFHRKAQQRRQRNTIKGVLDEGGNWRDVEEEKEGVFVSYFESLFSSNGCTDVEQVLGKVQRKVTDTMNTNLLACYTGEEVRKALKQMHASHQSSGTRRNASPFL